MKRDQQCNALRVFDLDFHFVPWKDIGYIIMFYVLDGKAGFAGEKAKR